MGTRLDRKRRRAQHWRQRAARIAYNEAHQEWGRRIRYFWNTLHPDPKQRVSYPEWPLEANWWRQAIAMADPQSRMHNRNNLSKRGGLRRRREATQ